MSHASGLTKFNPTNMRHTRATPPRSMSTNAPAQQMHTMDVMTAGTDTRLNDSMPNTCAELATIRPPADRPTKNMNAMMYRPHELELFMPVIPRPYVCWATQQPTAAKTTAANTTTTAIVRPLNRAFRFSIHQPPSSRKTSAGACPFPRAAHDRHDAKASTLPNPDHPGRRTRGHHPGSNART